MLVLEGRSSPPTDLKRPRVEEAPVGAQSPGDTAATVAGSSCRFGVLGLTIHLPCIAFNFGGHKNMR